MRSALASSIRDSHQIVAVGGRGEMEAGIRPKLPIPIIIIGIIKGESRQTVWDEFGSWRMRLDDISRFVERMGRRARIKIFPSFAADVVKLKPGIGPLRHAKDFAHFPLQIH